MNRFGIEGIVKVLNKAAGFIQGRLSKRIHLRSTPHLKFFYDDSLNNAQQIEDLLFSIKNPDNIDSTKEDFV